MRVSLTVLAIACFFANNAQAQKSGSLVENTCNYAGTYVFGQFIGQSSDITLPTVYLCAGDSLRVDHNGDALLSGDPQPNTFAGITYVYYNCLPTIAGDNLGQIIANESCLLSGSANGLIATSAVPNGGKTWFTNSGQLQIAFNEGKPLSLYHAPATIDDFLNNTYETAMIGGTPGPCVNVNIGKAFEVVYLNPIKANGVSNNFGDDCIGKFSPVGGFPQYDPTTTYSIEVSMVSDPSVKGLIQTAKNQLFHNAYVNFSVHEPGVYEVSIEDGKSCGYHFTVDMTGCDASDNIGLDFDEVPGAIGQTVCVPLRVKNFDIFSGAFSVNWDPNVLKYKGISDLNPEIANFFTVDSFMNISQAPQGQLSSVVYNPLTFAPVTISDDESLFSICFEVLDTIYECSPIFISNSITSIIFENSLGLFLGISTQPGGVCKSSGLADHAASKSLMLLNPNPVAAGQPTLLRVHTTVKSNAQLVITDGQGKILHTQNILLSAGDNAIPIATNTLPSGVYFVSLRQDGVGIWVEKLVVGY